MSEVEPIRMIGLVLVVDGLVNGVDQVGHIAVQTISRREGFQVEPEAFNGIEKGTIAGQPHHMEPLSEQSQCCH